MGQQQDSLFLVGSGEGSILLWIWIQILTPFDLHHAIVLTLGLQNWFVTFGITTPEPPPLAILPQLLILGKIFQYLWFNYKFFSSIFNFAFYDNISCSRFDDVSEVWKYFWVSAQKINWKYFLWEMHYVCWKPSLNNFLFCGYRYVQEKNRTVDRNIVVILCL